MKQEYNIMELYDEKIGYNFRGRKTKKLIEIRKIDDKKDDSKVLFCNGELLTITSEIVKDSFEFEFANKDFKELIITDLDNLKIKVTHKMLTDKFNSSTVYGDFNYVMAKLANNLNTMELQFIMVQGKWQIYNAIKI